MVKKLSNVKVTHIFYATYDKYTIKQNEVVMDQPFYLGFAVFEMIKLLVYEAFYNNLQPYFGEKNIQCHYIDTNALVLSIYTKDFIKDLQNLNDFFDFRNLNKSHEIFSNENQKLVGKIKIETPKNVCIDDFLLFKK